VPAFLDVHPVIVWQLARQGKLPASSAAMRFPFAALALCAACAAGPHPTMTWPALDANLLADAAATFNFKLGVPAPLAIAKDGGVLFRRTPPRSFASDLFELDPQTGEVTTLATAADLLGAASEHLSDAEKARRERTRTATKGVVDIGLSEDGRAVLVPLGGKLFVIDRRTQQRIAIDPGGDAYDPQLSPDGTRIAFVRDGDLYVVTADAGARPARITQHPADLEYGVAEFAAQEELGRRRGFWWSPDGKSIAFQRTDARPVDTLYVADARHPEHPPVPFKYPRAGTANAIVDLGVVAATGGAIRWITWDTQRWPYLADVSWHGKAPLTAVVLDRDQQELAMLAIDPITAGIAALVIEHDDAWINLAPGAPRWLDDGSAFLWMTEAPGAWVLQLRARDGKLIRQLTQPELGLRGIVGVDEQLGNAYFAASPPANAPSQDVWRIRLDGTGDPIRLSSGEGVNEGMFDHGVLVLRELGRYGGLNTYAITKAGAKALPSVAEVPALVPTTQLEVVQVGGRDQHVAITRPRAFVAGTKYPVLLKVYAGPHSMTVVDARDAYVMDQWYADAGFIVVRTDGRGTPNRGRAWERAILKDLITVPMEDQVGALQALGARHPELDLARVGVFGWSFGGYFSTMAVLLRPDVFKAAVAGAPVTDWQLYDTAYTERYMKTPAQNPEGYTRTSALTYAAQLTRPLLIIHGITDDNVHFAHALALIEALYVAGKRAEVITLSATHMVPDPKLNLAREQVQVDFFREHLGPPP
jgi:dipeptidyl-peptidase-4